MQEHRHSQSQQTRKRKWFGYVKILAKWATWPIWRPVTWFYRLGPIEKFTAVLCVIGSIQAWAFIVSERASVGISDVTLYPRGPIEASPADNPRIVEFVVTVKNAGHSLAKTVNGFVDISDPKVPLPSKPIYRGDPRPLYDMLVPEGVHHLTLRPKGSLGLELRFSEENVRDINAGKLNVWVYGYITYQDAFSWVLGSRTLGYCYHYDPRGDPELGLWGPCDFEAYVYSH
jgi:hypothetical protein